MRRLEGSLPNGRTLLWLDVVLALWSAAWIAIGIAVSQEVEGLTELSGTVRAVGEAVESFGAALGSLGEVPVVGESLGDTLETPAQQVQEAGQSAQSSGESSRESIDALSTLLGLAIALIPSVPLLALYLPARVSRVRDARAIAARVRLSGEDPMLQEFLARRAAQSLSYRRLAEITPEPWRDLAEGRFEPLALAELERLGVTRKASPPGEAEPPPRRPRSRP